MRIAVRVLTPLMVAGLVVGAVFEHRVAVGEVERQFNEKQMYLALQASERLTEVFREVRKFLLLLGHIDAVVSGQPGSQDTIATVVAQLQEHGAIHACLVTSDQTVLLTTAETEGDLQALLARLTPCRETTGLCVRGPIASQLSESGWVLVTSVTSPKRIGGASAPRVRPAPGGEILMVLDWGKLQDHIERITRLSKDTYSWVLDQRGQLIMHLEHRQQLGRAGFRPGAAACRACHTSFALQRRMVEGKRGTGRIAVRNRESKLVAYSPFMVGHHRWSLAVATPTAYVTAKERRSMTRIFIFTGTIMLVMIGGALLLDREARRRIRAADSFNQDLERKVDERTNELKGLYDKLADLQAKRIYDEEQER